MQERPNLITVTGHPGAGKSTACQKLAEELGWEYFYTGMVMRKMAEEMGITIAEINKLAETDKSIDQRVDDVYTNLYKSEKPLVIDARLAWHFLPSSFKVRFEVPVSIGAQRVLNADKRLTEKYRDLPTAMQTMAARRDSERVHYRNSYGIQNVEDYNHFDLVLDTAYSTPERNVSFVRSIFSLWQKGICLPKVWLSPKSLYPTHSIETMSKAAISDLARQFAEHGYDTLQPVLAVMYADQVYVVDGHKRVAAALKAGCDFVPIVLLDEESDLLRQKTHETYVRSVVTPTVIDAWQREHDFTFAMPPVALEG
jgi:cytidylate kinase